MNQVRVAVLASFVSVALAACNGGGGSEGSTPTAGTSQQPTGSVSDKDLAAYRDASFSTESTANESLCLQGPTVGVTKSNCTQSIAFSDGFAGTVAGHQGNKDYVALAPIEAGQFLLQTPTGADGKATSLLVVTGKPVLIKIPAVALGLGSATAPDVKLTVQSDTGVSRVVILPGNGKEVTGAKNFSAYYYNLPASDVSAGRYTIKAEIVFPAGKPLNVYYGMYTDSVTDTFVVQPALKPLTVEIHPVVVTNANTNTTYPIVTDYRKKTFRDANGTVTAEINEVPDLPNLTDLQEILSSVLPFQQITVRQSGSSSIVVRPTYNGYSTPVVAYNNASGSTYMPVAQSREASSRPEYSASIFEVWKSAMGFDATNAIGNVVQVGVTSYDFPMLSGFDFSDTPAGGEWPRVVIRGGNFFWTNILGTLFHSTGLKWTNTTNYGTNYSKNLELAYVNESATPAFISGDKVVIGMSPAMQKLGGANPSRLVLNRGYSFGGMGGQPFYPDEDSTKIQQMDAWALKQFYQKLQAMGF